MRIRSWPFLLAGFGALLTLIGLASAALHNRMEQVRADVQALQKADEESSRAMEELRSDIYLSGILLRDYLLGSSPADVQQRDALERLHTSMQDNLRVLEGQPGLKDRPEIQRLHHALEGNWRATEPVFEWTLTQRAAEALPFLRQYRTPLRQQAFQLASEIENVRLAQSQMRQQEVMRTQEDLEGYLRRVATVALILGAAVALVSVARTHSLEASATRHLRLIESGAADLRRLSLKLSRAQEEERKGISRELHDQVGQMLTALRLELVNIEDHRRNDGDGFARHMADARKLVEETLRTIRDISMGLRPSVLDELGLGPALRWQAREFTRRSGVPVEIQIDGTLDGLGDTHRTCVYRVVQESLTNCARHARASQVRIAANGSTTAISFTVEDNGIGFDLTSAGGRGLGLLGAQERVRELGGTMEILSQPSKGTMLRCEIPIQPEAKV